MKTLRAHRRRALGARVRPLRRWSEALRSVAGAAWRPHRVPNARALGARPPPSLAPLTCAPQLDNFHAGADSLRTNVTKALECPLTSPPHILARKREAELRSCCSSSTTSCRCALRFKMTQQQVGQRWEGGWRAQTPRGGGGARSEGRRGGATSSRPPPACPVVARCPRSTPLLRGGVDAAKPAERARDRVRALVVLLEVSGPGS